MDLRVEGRRRLPKHIFSAARCIKITLLPLDSESLQVARPKGHLLADGLTETTVKPVV